MKKNIAILGSTGSIGKQALEVISAFPSSFNVVSIAAKNEVEDIISQIKIFKPLLVSVASEEVKEKIAAAISRQITKIVVGEEGLMEAATHKGVNLVVAAIPGAFSLKAVMEAVKAKKDIALATKEVLVAAGDIFMEEAKKAGIKIFPIDSEHSAIAQCLLGEKVENIKKIIITASGGPFLNATPEKLAKVTAKDALGHPTWKMGPKITIDSASLMNKGFEVIEAHYLFGLDYSKIEVVIHPQSIVHSMVEFIDGSIKARLGAPDMRIPIQLALLEEIRQPNHWHRLDLTKTAQMTFQKPDLVKFPCLSYAYQAGKARGTVPAVLNSANEEGGNLFLKGKIAYLQIDDKIKAALKKLPNKENPSLEEILSADKAARDCVI